VPSTCVFISIKVIIMFLTTIWRLGLVLTIAYSPALMAQSPLGLQEAINLAVEAADPSVQALQQRAGSEEERATAAQALPDPRIGVGFANVPVNDFNLTREPFTQIQLSARQAFPRGSTLRLTAKDRSIRSEDFTARAQAQLDTLVRDVSIAWFNAWYSYAVETELKALNTLLAELNTQQESDFATSGSAALQRLYRTELEQALIEDRLDAMIQERDQAVETLARYIGREAALRAPASYQTPQFGILTQYQIEDALANNPALISMAKRVDLAHNDVNLAKEAYNPEFGVEARYGRRGGDRSDFGSVMLTFDLPIFTSKKQAPALRAAKRREQAARLDRDALVRDLTKQALSYVVQVKRLERRIQRFEGVTLERARDAVTASRNAYGAGNIDFAELVRAEIALRDLRVRRATLYRDLHVAQARLKFIVGDIV
jgi:outer membrane protein TolC